MEWYAFGLDKVLMFLLAGTSFLAIVLTVMFGISLVEKGLGKHIE
jgi:hypothetical protein